MPLKIRHCFFVLVASGHVFSPVAAEDARIMVQALHDRPPTHLVYSGDGKLLVSSSDSTIKIWSVSGRLLRNLTRHSGSVSGILFFGNDQRLASVDNEGKAIIWSRDGRALKEITVEKHAKGIAVMESKKILLVAGNNVTLFSFDGQLIRKLEAPFGYLQSIAASPTDGLFITGTYSGDIDIWDADGNSIRKLKTAGIIQDLQISSDGRKFLSTHTGIASSFLFFKTQAKKATLWSIDGNELKVFSTEEQITSAAMTPDAATIALGLKNDTIEIAGTDGNRLNSYQLREVSGIMEGVTALALHPTNGSLATANWGEKMVIRDNSGVLVMESKLPWDGSSMPWSIPNAYFRGYRRTHNGEVFDVSLDVEPNELLHKVLLISINGRAAARKNLGEQIISVTVSPDARMIASGSDGKIFLTGRDGETIKTFTGHGTYIEAVAFNNTGTILASGGQDNIVNLWDIKSGKLLKSLAGHDGSFKGLFFNDAGDILFARAGETAFIWDVKSGGLIARFVGERAPWEGTIHNYAVVTPDGRFDYRGNALPLLHWVVGDETIPLEQFKEKYHTPGLLTKITGGKIAGAEPKPSTPVSKPEIAVSKRLIGKVFQIKGNGDIVIYTKASGSLRAGKKLKILNGANYVDATISNTLHTNVTAKAKATVAVGNPVFE